MSVVKHLKPPNWDVGTTSSSTLFVETDAKQSDVISEARKIIKKDASNVWTLFVYSRHKKKVQWECPLCFDPLHFGKTKSVLSLKLRVLRHLGTCHMTCRFNFEEHLFSEWRFLQDEFGKKIDIFQSVPKSVKQMEKHRSSINFITHLDDPGLVEVFGANAFCEICCEGVWSLDHLRKHGELENKLSFSEFFQCDEKSIDEYPFPHPLLGYGCEESCSEQQTTSTGTAAYTWCCRIPSCWNYILSSFPTTTILKAHALRHFEEFHGGLFNEGLFENEWTIIHAESDLTQIDLRRQRATVMDVACPDEFVHPSTRQLIPFEYRGHRVCQFCFFTSSDEKKFRRHLRRHGYREEKKPFLHPESLDNGVPAVRELMVDFRKHLHPVHYFYGDKNVYKGQKKLWEKSKQDVELDLSHSQSTSVEFVDEEILEHLERNQKNEDGKLNGENARREPEQDCAEENENISDDRKKKDSEEKELMNNMELEFDQETGGEKVVAENSKKDHLVSPEEKKNGKDQDDQDTEYDYTKEDAMRNEKESDDRVLEKDERMNKENLELDKENSERTQIEEKTIEKKKEQITVPEKTRGKKRKDIYREDEDVVRREKKCRKIKEIHDDHKNLSNKQKVTLAEVVEDSPSTPLSSLHNLRMRPFDSRPQYEEGEPEHQHQHVSTAVEDTVLTETDSPSNEATVTVEDTVSECEEVTVKSTAPSKKVKKRVSWAPPEEAERYVESSSSPEPIGPVSCQKCDQSVSNSEKAIVEHVEEHSKKHYKCQLCSSKFSNVILVTVHLCEMHTVTTVLDSLIVTVESQNMSDVRQQCFPSVEQQECVQATVPSVLSDRPSSSPSSTRTSSRRRSVVPAVDYTEQPHPVGTAASESDSAIVRKLLVYQQKNGNPEFARKAIHHLVNKLESKKGELDYLLKVLKTAGKSPTRCVTIPRTIDGRIQVGTWRNFAHVIYSKVWRWPDVSSKYELQMRSCCVEEECSTCINPFHFDRVEPKSRLPSCSRDVHKLMSFQKESVETPAFVLKSIQYLVKKLKDKKDELDALFTALQTNGRTSTKCVTVPRTNDGRICISGRPVLYNVLYTRIWRWPTVSWKELRRLSCCTSSSRGLHVCVNPYHYARVVDESSKANELHPKNLMNNATSPEKVSIGSKSDTSIWSDTDGSEEKNKKEGEKDSGTTTGSNAMTTCSEELTIDDYVSESSESSSPNAKVRSVIIDSDSEEVCTDVEEGQMSLRVATSPCDVV